ncbi:Glycosyltransferase Type 1 [Halomicronema hongdechloris C2206]|uniref:Glycosyltransferase Type 1 n=1 Tax=Halomicronema hongdechloris C2206 TaxID=1641165 RepID=A0A1V8NPR7_9CYAN|nr:glycosyltransferase family 4 protein [Halomicronema hongdechloris]ASC72109.1 Glycosyltransferase Type 1 [Halomicronema hongdechloris C2206]
MKILSVHNKYKVRGGEDESSAAENHLLSEKGHTVSLYEKSNHDIAHLNPIRLAGRTIWSQTTYNDICELLEHTSHDVVHVQNFFPLISPSVYYAAQANKVPVVQTLRNYRLLCPNALFFRQGKVCEDCLGKPIPYPGILHGCYRNDRAATAATAAMSVIHTTLNTWQNQVDLFITLTQFARKKFIEGGLPPEKIVVKPNFVHPDPGLGSGQGEYALYVGRLSVEKGLDTLLSAWKLLRSPVPLKIVGDGPLADQVAEVTTRLPNIEWLGRRPMAEVHNLMGEAQFLVFPSKWYETFGRVAVEAFAKGTPVLAADLGAIAELVENERTGLRFCPGNAVDLADKVDYLLAQPKRLEEMRRSARAEFESCYTADLNHQQLIQIYEHVRMLSSLR